MNTRGFSLLELLAVLVILALLAGAASISLKGPLQIARSKTAREQIQLADRLLRDHARRFARPAQLTINLDQGSIVTNRLQGGSNAQRVALNGLHLQRVALAEEYVECGVVTIDFNALGQSSTYAIRLRTAPDEPAWLVFLGLTGQTLYLRDDTEIKNLRQFLQADGTDTD